MLIKVEKNTTLKTAVGLGIEMVARSQRFQQDKVKNFYVPNNFEDF